MTTKIDERVQTPPEVLTIDEAATFLRIPKPTLYLYARCGEVPATKIGKRWIFSRIRLTERVQGKVR